MADRVAKQVDAESVSLKEYATDMIESLGRTHDMQMADLKVLLRSQFEAQEKAGIAQFEAQEKAGQIAFTAQQTALATGLTAAERGVETALAAAKEATNKAETNANERFNQFRSESGLQLKTLSDKLDSEIGRMAERLGELATSLNEHTGRGAGIDDARNTARLDTGQMLVFGGFLLAVGVAIQGFIR